MADCIPRMSTGPRVFVTGATGFIGLATVFRVTDANRPKSELTSGQSPDDGPIDVQLASSADGRTWRRSQPRLNVIPRGAPGTSLLSRGAPVVLFALPSRPTCLPPATLALFRHLKPTPRGWRNW